MDTTMPTPLPTRESRRRAPRRAGPSRLALVPRPPAEPGAVQRSAKHTHGPRRVHVVVGHVLTAIRATIGLVLVACGASGFLHGFAGQDASGLSHSVVALGGSLVLAGSAIPLLKGLEVLLETLLSAWPETDAPGGEGHTATDAHWTHWTHGGRP